MKNFFIHVDPVFWREVLLSGFVENLDRSPDTIDCIMAVIEAYVNYRRDLNPAFFETREKRTALVRSILEMEGLPQAKVERYDELLDVLWCQLAPAINEVRHQYRVHFISIDYMGETLQGVSGAAFAHRIEKN
jgi:hypothetical protein